MSLINGSLFAFVASRIDVAPVLKAVAVLGIILCIIWELAVYRLAAWVGWWEAKLIEIEPQYFGILQQNGVDSPGLPSTFRLFRGRKGTIKTGLSTRAAGKLLPILFFLAWMYIVLFTPLTKVLAVYAEPYY